MAILYRVFPWLEGADAGQAGHPLFVPSLAGGRIDNPDHYLVLYLSDGAAGACAETFDYRPTWDVGMLRGSPGIPGSVRALARYTLDSDSAVCNLDDAHRLVEFELRPSQVVTRDRMVTRAWALAIFGQRRWGGISWWSYHDPRSSSHGIWAIDALTVDSVEALTLEHPAVVEAADVLNRPLA